MRLLSVFIILFVALPGCKELTEVEQLKDDLIAAKIEIAELNRQIGVLKMNRLDVLEVDEEVKACKNELSEQKNDNWNLQVKIFYLEAENRFYRDAVQRYIEMFGEIENINFEEIVIDGT